jgi:nucleotide-binding universal stress UspA family protein
MPTRSATAWRQGLDYLRTVEVQFVDTPVEVSVRSGHPGTEILREADAFGADLIAVATESRPAIRRALCPGVAERLFRRASAPVMLLRAEPRS